MILEDLEKPRNVGPQSVEPAYDKELADKVYHIYQEDFDQFGYDQESWRGL